jgi:hypothetical protein
VSNRTQNIKEGELQKEYPSSLENSVISTDITKDLRFTDASDPYFNNRSIIILLTYFFDKSLLNNSIKPTHISLYLALFQFWISNKFINPISIHRAEVMSLSKIASIATYHKCIRELHDKGFIKYQPSHNPFKSSMVFIILFDAHKY